MMEARRSPQSLPSVRETGWLMMGGKRQVGPGWLRCFRLSRKERMRNCCPVNVSAVVGL